MKTKVVAPERQRCTMCGHPNREHHSDGCTVPRCGCETYVPRTTKK